MKKTLLICLFISLVSVVSKAQHFHWVKTGLDSNLGSNIASSGNLVVSTSVGNLIRTGIPPLYTLAAHDTSGNILWNKNIFGRFGIGSISTLPAVTINNNQQVLMAGCFRDSLFIDSLIYKAPAISATMFFLAKFDTGGKMLWVRNSTFSAGQHINSVNTTTDAAGNIYLSGRFSGTLTFGNAAIHAAGTWDAFLVKYDANGNFLWAKATGTQDLENIVKSKATASGSVYLVSSVNSPSKQIINKFDTNGNLIWTRTIAPAGGGPGGQSSSVNLEVDNANNLYLTGNYTGSMDFTNSTSLTSIVNFKTFLAKYSANGTFRWAKNLASGNNFTTTVPAIFYAGDNTLAIAGAFKGSIDFDSTQFSFTSANDYNGLIVKTDTAGTLFWAKQIPGLSGGNEAISISGDSKGTYFISGTFSGSANFSGAYIISPIRKNFIAQLKSVSGKVVTGSTYNLVTGNIFLDENLNGLKDPDETGAAEVFINTSTFETGNIISPEGNYNLFLPAGNFTLIPSPKKYYTYAPATRAMAIQQTNQVYSEVDFAMQAIPNQLDVKVNLTNLTPARPGFGFSYLLTFKNAGTKTVSDTLTLLYDPSVLSYINSTTNPVTQQTGKLNWYYLNLQPNETRTITVNFQVSVSAALDSVLQANASIKPFFGDLFINDNFDTTQVEITGSFDPNDIQVNRKTISAKDAASGTFLEYTVRFQNTGTDTAFTVMVSDKIPAGLQLHTLEMLAASHPYVLSLFEHNRLEWRFNNILLPDSNRNEPASHGFIRFRIKSTPGLIPNDTIANQAAIYFDYNAPVITNYAVTKVSEVPPTSPDNFATLKLYPNPARNYVMVAAEFENNASAKLMLVNMLGQKLSIVILPASNRLNYELPLSNLPRGIYLVQLETTSGMQTQRLVIQ